MTNPATPAFLRMADLAIGARVARALRVVAERRIADLVADRPKTAEALSIETGLPADALRRLLGALSTFGVFEEYPDGTFGKTELSAYMCEGSVPSVREMILILNDNAVLKGWHELTTTLESGTPAFDAVNGTSFFQHIESDPERRTLMGKFMTGIYGPEGPKIAANFSFQGYKSLIDVGGGPGHVLVEILKRNPHMRGALFELPQTAEMAREFLTANGFSNCEVIAGDFFNRMPSGFDAYFFKSVLHDWSDGRASQILRVCRDAMPDHGRVLIAEIVMERGRPVRHPHKLIDLEMMVTFGGKERTALDFEKLLGDAGLKLEQITKVQDSFLAVLEASKSTN